MKASPRPFDIEEGHPFVALALPSEAELASDCVLPSGLRIYGTFPQYLAHLWADRLGTLQIQELAACNLWVVASGPMLRPLEIPVVGARRSWTMELQVGDNARPFEAVRQILFALGLVRFSVSGRAFLLEGHSVRRNPWVSDIQPLEPIVHHTSLRMSYVSEDGLKEAEALAFHLVDLVGQPEFSRLSKSVRAAQEALSGSDAFARLAGWVRVFRGLMPYEPDRFDQRCALFVGNGREDEAFVRSVRWIYELEEHLLTPGARSIYEIAALEETLVRWEETGVQTMRRILGSLPLMQAFGSLASQTEFWAQTDGERADRFGEPIDARQAIEANRLHRSAEAERSRATLGITEGAREAQRKLAQWVRP